MPNVPPPSALQLSRRERQIMDVLYRDGEGTVSDVLAAIPDPPSYSTVRALLRVLEDKGHVTHAQDGPRYVYRPTAARDNVRGTALKHVLRTFFEGSASDAVAALLDMSDVKMTDAELDRVSQLIAKAKREGR